MISIESSIRRSWIIRPRARWLSPGRLQLGEAVEDILKRFGQQSILNACWLDDFKMPADGRNKVQISRMMHK